MRKGFSLVELSIVLVILGLLVGGILAGQSLIHAAELRAHMRFNQEFAVAWTTFRDKYFAYPGDMTNATSFWGDYNSVCPDAAITNGSPGTCNGNGDGKIAWSTPSAEAPHVGPQLTLAGLGNYTLSGGGTSYGHYIASNNISQSEMWTHVGANSTSAADLYTGAAPLGSLMQGNALQTARYNSLSAGGTNSPRSPVFNPEDTWNLDSKMDDGVPVSGAFQAANGMTYGQVASIYDNCLTASGSTYVYSLNNTSPACRHLVRLP